MERIDFILLAIAASLGLAFVIGGYIVLPIMIVAENTDFSLTVTFEGVLYTIIGLLIVLGVAVLFAKPDPEGE